MTIFLDASQSLTVETKRKTPDSRPKYFSAAQRKFLTISPDFEAFLILQGDRNKETVKWLEQAQEYAIRDSDRDALAAVALQNDQDDAFWSELEIAPIIRQFQRFREGYNLNGFEQVTEAGALLNDLQRPMLELQNIMARLKHRQIFAKVSLSLLGSRGLTDDMQKQVRSWFGPLTAY